MQSVQDALSKAEFYSDEGLYRLIHLPARAITAAAGVMAEVGESFMALIVDKDEVTLMLDDEAFEEYKHRFLGYETGDTLYRLITIDVALEPTLIGFMAHVSTALATAKIPIFPYAAYARDHLFVPAAQFDAALKTLNELKQG